jgi:NAD(P)-dependent dehydrogenase (short-subunit alcohol dehydrogenase family)
MNSPSLFTLSSSSILVTGASSGIGRAVAVACANVGAKIILHGRDLDRLEETFKALAGSGHKIMQGDFIDDDQVNALADNIGQIHGVCHCAGIHGVAPMRLVQKAMLMNVMQVNYFAPIILTQRLLLKKKILPGGSIVFISSIAALTGKVGVGPYSGSKAALLGTMRPLALEVAKYGVRVNAICPGIVKTPLFDDDYLQSEGLDKSYPLGLGEPEDIAHAAVFFLADSSRKITGTAFSIDGGVPLT